LLYKMPSTRSGILHRLSTLSRAGLAGSVLLAIALAGGPPATAASPAAKPNTTMNATRALAGDRLFGLSLSGSSQIPAATQLAASLNRHLDLIDLYSSWESGFPSQAATNVVDAGSTPEVTWDPWNSNIGASSNPFPLQAIAAGTFDAYIAQFASAAASLGSPLLLRFAPEMNGNWLPWGIGVNGNTSAEYVAAYRHVHSIFDIAGASNVIWVWSPNVIGQPGTDPAADYPGDGFVDAVGIDGYNTGTATPGGVWQSPQQVFGATLSDVGNFAPGKPIVINETGSSETGGSKAQWITELFGMMASSPSVVGFVWSEYVGRADWPITTSASSIAAMRQALDGIWSGSAPTSAYWEVATDGGVFGFGAPFLGSMGDQPLNKPIVGMAPTPDGGGYWEVASDGGIFAFGDAQFHGSMAGKPLNASIVGIVPTADGAGYWEVASDGGLFSFGDARFYGSTGGKPLNKPLVGTALDPATGGYWEVASDGGIFGFNAPFLGSMGATVLNQPIVGIVATPDGQGYQLVAADGGLFSFGEAHFYGSMGGHRLNSPIVSLAGTPDGQGYWEVASDGGLFSFGDAAFKGSMGGRPLNQPIVGLANARG
jgi:hypothetical protein